MGLGVDTEVFPEMARQFHWFIGAKTRKLEIGCFPLGLLSSAN